MGKKNGKGQQRAAAKKKRRSDRLKKRSSGVSDVDGYRGNLSVADEDVMSMSDEEVDEYLANLRLIYPEEFIERLSEPLPFPMWDYDDPGLVEALQERFPGSTEEEVLDLLFSKPVRARFINTSPYLLPAYVVLDMDEDATSYGLLAKANRWHDDKKLWWHVTEETHIAAIVNPSGDIDPDEVDLDALKRSIV